LDLVEVQTNQVTLHHWSQQLADLRTFFKEHQLTRPEVQVTLLDRKKDIASNKTGNDFLYGTKIAPDFPIELFVGKWNNRLMKETDDHQAAALTNSGLSWNGLADGQIHWVRLKSSWKRSKSVSCLNCDQPTILLNFGLKQVGLFNRSPNFVSIYPKCRRSFVDESIKDVAGWMAGNLNTDFLPVGELVWGKRVELVNA